MRIRELFRRADALQKSRLFKIIASLVVIGLAIAFLVTFVVARNSPGSDIAGLIAESERQLADAAVQTPGEARGDATVADTGLRAVERVLRGGSVLTGVAVGVASAAGIALVVIWLGLGLTYLALGAVAVLVAWPLQRYLGMPGLAQLTLGLTALAASFTALMQGARILLSGPGPVCAIARNVLAEAVRMKVSLVFIVLLLVLLASLPLLLSPDQPLRYRVQAFLQYATGGAFWVVAFLTLFFSASTVTGEQRDKVIWQTVTKPVASWQYLLGKWLGVVTLGAVLMAVCGTTIFLFTEYLRSQPARGEDQAYVASDGAAISEDRLVLETQVLAARLAIGPTMPVQKSDPDFQKAVQGYIDNERVRDESFATDPARRAEVENDLYKSVLDAYRAIEPGKWETFNFIGLQRARAMGAALTLRYRVDMGSNRPDQTARLTFVVNQAGQIVRESGLGTWHTVSLTSNAITPDGKLELIVLNADGETGTMNPYTISFPRDGLEISYSVGSYRANFVRVMLVLLVKIAFLSMLTICASTFVSFPVACLVSMGMFFMAESAGYLKDALESYSTTTTKGQTLYLQTVATWIATGVQRVFAIYADLKPTTKLVDGRLLSFSSMSAGVAVLLGWTLVLYGAAVVIFRRRELATYSGQ